MPLYVPVFAGPDFSPLPLSLAILVTALQLIVLVFTVQHLVIPLAGFRTRRTEGGVPPDKVFAVLVPAHDEERVIGRLVENLQRLDYPSTLYDVYVIADHCSDRTAEVARAAGARVLERRGSEPRGKGHALEDAFLYILHEAPRRYDAAVIFDADNLVHPSFLRVVNARLCRGERLIQGYLDTKNPDDTWVTASFATSYWVSNRFWCLARNNLGLTALLGGTGMCIDLDLVREIGWGATSLTEDLEFTIRALCRGIRTTWAHDAVVYDEKPLTFVQSWHQRRRWLQGQFQVAWRYALPLLRAAVERRDLAVAEGVLLLFRPFYMMSATVLAILTLALERRFDVTTAMSYVFQSPVWMAGTLFQYVLPFLVAFLDRVPLRVYRFLPLFPLFNLSWAPLAWSALFGLGSTRWSHTIHTRSISVEELLSQRGGFPA
ncbi:MAG: glycosyltransferase family 2 protein [Clostridia bacterium]|nr:glycosyltransferase family 2 protein [Clostridia bacterium]